jgi:serine/threonine protein kinase
MSAPVLSARVAGVAAAALLLGGAGYAGRLLDAASGQRVAVEADRVARTAADAAREALLVQGRSVSKLAGDAVGIAPLAAALSARTNARGLEELLSSADWWAAYRSVSAAVSYQGLGVAFVQPGLRGVPFGQLIALVRSNGESVSTILAGSSTAHFVSAVVVPGASYLPPAILVLGRPIDEPMLKLLAETAGGSVLVMDGKRPIGKAGPDAELLETALRPDRVVHEPGWAMSWFSLGPELAMWVGTRPTDVLRAQAATDRRRKALIWTAAVLLSIPIVLVAFKRREVPKHKGRGPHARPRTRPITIAAPVAAAAPLPEIDALLARYTLMDRIAEGSIAEVFTAISQGGGGPRRTLVVKRLRADQLDNPVAVAHFTEEASLLSKLAHQNLVPVFDNGEVDGTYFIAEEYVVGRDLGRLTKRLSEAGRRPLSAAGTLYVMHEILGGLAYLHAPCPGQDAPAGFVHRDLTPQNVMVSRLGQVKLLDFRILRAHERPATSELGKVQGQVDFMSPEQARGKAVDQRSDLFSVGLLLYHCAAGAPLYRGDTHYDRLSRAAQGPGQQELERINALPAPLPALLTRALQPLPDRRFGSATEFMAAVAPHVRGGEDEVAELISELFADQLQAEIDRLSEAAPVPAAARPDRRSG